MSAPLRVGLIGAGRIGRVHARALRTEVPRARLVRVADVVTEAAAALAADYQIEAAASTSDLIADPSVDALLICSSTDSHASLIIEGARAGKHIFCEKPIALDLTRIDEALGAVEAAGVTLMVGFNRRFDPNFATLKRRLTDGQIGTPHLLRITSRDPAPPPLDYLRLSGGLFLDMTIHDFDMARFLLGEVESVYATGRVLVDPAIGGIGDIDSAVVVLHFASGAIGTIDNSRQAVYGYDQRVELFGSDGMIMADNNFPTTLRHYYAGGVAGDPPLYFFLERYMASYAAELEAFVAAVLDDLPPPVSGHDGRAPVRLALAAQRSHQEGRPVHLSEIQNEKD